MTRYTLLALGLAVVVLVHADEPNQQSAKTADSADQAVRKITDQPMSVWMERKLDYSQSVFRALALGDLETVKLKAAQMNLVGKVEGFARIKNKPYQAQLHAFDRVSREIAQQADKGNIEGATLAFNQLTVSCVQCHKLLRADDRRENSAKEKQDPQEKAR